MVSDSFFQTTASVLIEVTDVNDNEPQFDQEVYEITDIVEETMPPPEGQFLLQVNMLVNFTDYRRQLKIFLKVDNTDQLILKQFYCRLKYLVT